MTDVRHRIGRHAKPGGIVIHAYAMPTGRLIDVRAYSPADVVTGGSDCWEFDVTLEPDEDAMVFVPFDGDSGRRILPPKPPGKVERFMARSLIPINAVVLAFNVVLLTLAIINHRAVWAVGMVGGCVAINIMCIRSVARRRRERQ